MNMNLYSFERLFIIFIIFIISSHMYVHVWWMQTDITQFDAHITQKPQKVQIISSFSTLLPQVLPQKKSKITHVIILNILISHGKIFSSNL